MVKEFNLDDGDLYDKAFSMGSTGTQYVKQLYDASANLTSTRDAIIANKNSTTIAAATAQYKNMQNDIRLTTDASYGNNDITQIFSEFNKWTDSSLPTTYQKSCSAPTKDNWSQSKDQCPSDYTYLAAGGSSSSKSCVSLNEWSNSQVSSRYTGAGCSAGNSDFTSVSQAALSYFQNLNTYIAANTALINKLLTENDNLNSQFVSMANNLLTTLTNINAIIQPLVTIFNDSLGTNGFGSIVNCSKI
jgi:hypothetical protein